MNIGDRVQTKNTLCPITGQIVDMYKNLVTIADDDAETEFDGYDEILKCYEGETDIHASTSFEVGLMNDLYYQLFYNYDS